NTERIRAYDAAGYVAISPIDYSGAHNLSFALTKRLWPIESILSAEFLQSLTNIRIWFPSAEEVGWPSMHVNSAFLATYIERWDAARNPTKLSWQYDSASELYSLIRTNDGLPILAHPWDKGQQLTGVPGLFGIE